MGRTNAYALVRRKGTDHWWLWRAVTTGTTGARRSLRKHFNRWGANHEYAVRDLATNALTVIDFK